MNREKKLIKNTFILTIGKICTQMITFFLLPLYTGILTTEEYGVVDLLNTLVSLFIPLVTLQIEQAVFRELIEYRNDLTKRKKIISSGFNFIVFQCLIYSLFFVIISFFVHNVYKYFLALNIIISIFSSFFLQIARGIGKNKNFAFASFLTALSTIICNILFLVVFKFRVNGMLIGTFIGHLIGVIFLFISLKLYNCINFKNSKISDIKPLIKYSLPLVPNQLSWWIFNTSDRVVVSSFLGFAFNGLLSAANKFSTVYITLYNVFHLSWTESISEHIDDADADKYFNKMFNTISFFFLSLSILLTACMPIIFKIMINQKFKACFNLIPILLIASFFNVIVSLLGSVYVAKKNTKEIAKTSIYSAIINLVSHLLMLKFIGLYAAAISTLLSYFIMSISRYKSVSKKYFKVCFDNKKVIISIIFYLLVLACYYGKNIYLTLIGILVALIYSILINRTNIKFIFQLLNKKVRKKNKNKQDKYQIIDLENSLMVGQSMYLYDSFDSDNINNYLDDLDRVKMKIRFNNSVIGSINFNKCSDEISDVILSETKVYNFEFNNDYFLRKGKYPKQIANNYELMKYIIDQDYNNLAYIDTDNIDKDILIDIINYAFTKVYYMKIKDNNIDFDINNMFKNSKIVKHSYFKECYSYIDKMNGRKKK